MKKFWNQIFRNLLSAIVAGICYAVFAYWENGTVDLLTVLAMIGVNFVLLCLLCLIAPPLRKLTGHDKKAENAREDCSEDSNETNSSAE